MKKNILLGSLLASVSVFGLSKAHAEAQPPTLKINGYTVVTAAIANQQRTDNGMGGTDPHVSIGASDLYFTITGKAANGLEYKYRINFETIPGSDMYINRNYIEINGTFGTFQAGNVKGPEDSMPESGPNMINGANGIDGTMKSVYNFSAGVISGVNFAGETSKATKVVFYSPEVMGFQLGVAYTPNTSHMGSDDRNNSTPGSAAGVGNPKRVYLDKNKKNTPFGTRNIVVGLTYKKIIEKWSYELAVVGVTEKSHLSITGNGSQQQYRLHDARSYQLSAVVGYDQWRVAAGWIDNGKSRIPKDPISAASFLGDTYLGNAGTAWNVGASYTVGAYQFASAYHRTSRRTDAVNHASSDILVNTVDFTALQGLKVFTEVDFVKTRTNEKAMKVQQDYFNQANNGYKAIGNNSAMLFMIGSKVSF